MKKIILALAISFGSVACVCAQGVKGNFFSSAELGTTAFSSNNESNVYPDGNAVNQSVKIYSFDITPQFGWYLSDHTVFGGQFIADYEHDSNDRTSAETGISSATITTSTSTYKIGPFLRYYFGDKPSSTMFYVQGAATIGSGSATNDNGTTTETNNGVFNYDLRGSLGITHFITKNVGLNIGLAYDYGHVSYNDVTPANTAKFTNSASTVDLTAGFVVVL